MKKFKIYSKHGEFTVLVDNEDYERIMKYNWFLCYKNKKKDYACVVRNIIVNKRNLKQKLHRFILNITDKSLKVDHINLNTLDNRKENLRICSITENNRNTKLRKNNTSGYKGVRWHKDMKKWHARITVNKKEIQLGFYNNINQAAQAYNDAAVKYFGKFAYLNDISK